MLLSRGNTGITICLLIVGILFLPLFVNAQLRVGPKAGFHLGRAVYADEEYRAQYSSQLKPGFQLGGVVNYRVTPVFSLHTELYYSLKGKKSQSLALRGDKVVNNAYYHYLDMPVLLRLSKTKNLKRHKLEYYFNVGPNIHYWLGGGGRLHNPEMYEFYDREKVNYKITFDEPEYLHVETLYVKEPNRIQMSLDFGAGLIFNLGMGQSIMIDIRNSLGLGKTYMGREDGGDFGLYNYSDNFKAVNHVFGISAAWLVDIDMQALIQKGRIRR